MRSATLTKQQAQKRQREWHKKTIDAYHQTNNTSRKKCGRKPRIVPNTREDIIAWDQPDVMI